jgi:spermidine/putrescine transport system substrate-binding protein
MAAEELVFLTWNDYLEPELVAEFEQETGAKVRLSYYSSDDHRNEIIAGSHDQNYDVVLIDGASMHAYAARGWLVPISSKSVPNLKHLDRRWRTAFPGAEEFGVPYFWGTLGIAYRKDLLPDGISSWKDFHQPPESLRGRISTLKSSRDIVGMALKALGYSANSNDRNEIREAGRLLAAQKPFIRTYGYVSVDEDSALVTGELWASMVYSGEVALMRRFNSNIEYVVPTEGTNLWCDYLAGFASSSHKDLAMKFIDFLNRPDVATRNAVALKYASPNAAARERLPKEDLENSVINPSEEVIARSEKYERLSPRAQKAVNSLFAVTVD